MIDAPQSPSPWAWLTIEEAREALQTGTGRGVKVAVLDSGVEVSHPGLGGLELADDVVMVDQRIEVVPEPGRGEDLLGHGTAVASIIRRIAPEAQIGSFRILGGGARARVAHAAALEALKRGYHVLNCSIGSDRKPAFLLFKDWLDEAYVRGVSVVSACNNTDFGELEWPAHFSHCITVNMAASREPKLYYRKDHIVSFAAPGEKIEVPWLNGAFQAQTGSSFAAPWVAGMVARLLSVHPGLSAPLVKAALMNVATPWSDELTVKQTAARR